MAWRCKPGDFCMVIAGPVAGTFLTVLEVDAAGDWTFEGAAPPIPFKLFNRRLGTTRTIRITQSNNHGQPFTLFTAPDDCLQPIRPPAPAVDVPVPPVAILEPA